MSSGEAAAQLRPQQRDVHLSAVALDAPDHRAGERIAVGRNGGAQAAGVANALDPRLWLAAVDALDEVEGEVAEHARDRHRGRVPEPEVPQLVADPEVEHAVVAAAVAPRPLEMGERRAREVARLPAGGREAHGGV